MIREKHMKYMNVHVVEVWQIVMQTPASPPATSPPAVTPDRSLYDRGQTDWNITH